MKYVLTLIIFLCTSALCEAKARFWSMKEMIQGSELIAIVDINSIDVASKKGGTFTYEQKVTGSVELVLKGSVGETIDVYGMETFICATCRYEKGRSILFLTREDKIYNLDTDPIEEIPLDEPFWVGSNWHLGIRPITEDKILWFKDETNRFEMVETPLFEVIDEIKTIIQEQNKNNS